MLRLSVTVGTDEWVFGFPQKEVVIGSDPKSTLVLEHDTVAPRHVKLTRGPDRTVIECVGNSSVILNGEPFSEVRWVLHDGDVIEVGVYELELLSEDPPAKVEQDFLDAIARTPNDDAPRAVYSDWLEENGRPEHARFLRAQLELRVAPAHSNQWLELSQTIMALAPKMSLAWRRAVAKPHIENCHLRAEVDCPKTWDELQKTDKDGERWCGACKKNVYYANNISTARRLAIAGHCVSIDLVVPRGVNDLKPQPIRMGGAILARPTHPPGLPPRAR